MRMVTLLAASSDDPARIPTTEYIIQNSSVVIRFAAIGLTNCGLRSFNSVRVSRKELLEQKGQTLSQP
jgi:hypothetical protein